MRPYNLGSPEDSGLSEVNYVRKRKGSIQYLTSFRIGILKRMSSVLASWGVHHALLNPDCLVVCGHVSVAREEAKNIKQGSSEQRHLLSEKIMG